MQAVAQELPYEQEREIVRQLWEKDIAELYPRVFQPFVIFDKAIVISKLKIIKSKLGELGV